MTDPQIPETLTAPPTPSTESALAELTRASDLLESNIASLQQRISLPIRRLSPNPSSGLIDGLTTTRHLLACIEDDAPARDGRVGYPATAREWSPLFHARFEECIGVCYAISVWVEIRDARSDGINALNGVVEKLGEGLRVLVRAANL